MEESGRECSIFITSEGKRLAQIVRPSVGLEDLVARDAGNEIFEVPDPGGGQEDSQAVVVGTRGAKRKMTSYRHMASRGSRGHCVFFAGK